MRTFRSGDRSSASGRSRSYAPGSSGPVIPPIAAGATYDWAIEDLALANDDPISAWVDSIGGISADGAGGTRPLYKTGITPNGVATARFDGVDDILLGDASTIGGSGTKHWFVVAAFRPASSADRDVLFVLNNATYPFIMESALVWNYDFGTYFRNGISSMAVYPNGRFALYEVILDSGANGTPSFAQYAGTGPGAFDISRVLLYDTEVTGGDLTNTRENLILTYGIPL